MRRQRCCGISKPPLADTIVKLAAARGETVSGQAAWRPAQAARSLRAGGSGTARRSPRHPVRVHPPSVGPLDYRAAQLAGSAAGRTGGEGPLFLARPVLGPEIDAPASITQPLWIEVDISRDAIAGDYVGTLAVRRAGGTRSLPLRLKVWDFEMPAGRHQQVTNWFAFPGAGFSPAWDSPAFWDLAARYAKIMVAHRQTCSRPSWAGSRRHIRRRADIDATSPFWTTGPRLFRGRDGAHGVFQAGRTRFPWTTRRLGSCRPIFLWRSGTGVRLTPEAKLRGILGQLETHVYGEGLEPPVMFHVQDEPFLHSVPTYRKVGEIVHRAAPSVQVIEAVEATGFGDAIDVLVPKLNHLDLWLPYFQKSQARGKNSGFTPAAIRSGGTPTGSSTSHW